MTGTAGRLVAGMLLVLAGAWGAGAETVRGYVIDGDQNRAGDVEIAFLIRGQDGAMVEMLRTRSDESGAFQFSGPFLTAGTRFALTAYYDGASYPSSMLTAGAQDAIIIEVFETGTDASQLRITSDNLFLDVIESNLEVSHLVQVENDAPTTYVGPLFEEHPQGLEFSVPAGLAALTSHTGELIRRSDTRIFDTQPLPPGPSQVAFTFRVPAAVFDGRYVHEILYPTQLLELFIRPADVDLGPPFDDLGTVTLKGQSYRHYRASELTPGQRLVIDLPFDRPLRWTLKWALLALVPAMALVALALSRRPPSMSAVPATAATDRLESERLRLLQAIAQVERAQQQAGADEAGQLAQQRELLMAQARDLYRRLPQ